jgi:HAD superfamily hydrolase (TIGR01509 family)
MFMTIKAVIFDLDGTIATFNLDYKTVRAEVRNLLLNSGIPASLLSVNENIFDMLNGMEIYLKNQGKPTSAMEKLRVEAMNIAEKYEMEAATQTSLLSGSTETLRDLKVRKLKLALCTINSEKSMDYILKRFNLTEYFDTTVPREKTAHIKPHPQHLQIALDTLKAKPQETLVVGDSPSDMQAARDLKTVAVGLPTGVSTTEQLTRSGANYIITNITDLPRLIEQINKTPP